MKSKFDNNYSDELNTFLPSEFLSEEDLDLKNLSWDELIQLWNDWLEQAQSTNDSDVDHYSHSAFMSPDEYEKFYNEDVIQAPARRYRS
jgi:hypothetical protein